MGNIAENYSKIHKELPQQVKLIAVSKTKPIDQIMQVYGCGQRLFGESKAQEMLPKFEQLPKDIQWHMIGHLQTNKVKYIAPFVSLIHSVDSFKLLKTINKEAQKNDRVIDCLLQVHIAEEETKFGLDFDELTQLLESDEYHQLKNIRITGLMCMATFTDDQQQIHREFGQMRSWYTQIKEKYFAQDSSFCELSMGMSDDYSIAISEGSTMIRVGSLIFGGR
jgi:PLP dependent protein